MNLANILIEHPSNRLNSPFLYYFDELDVKKGIRVVVEFSSKKLIGYVHDIYTTDKTLSELEDEHGFSINKIISVMDNEPILNEELMELAQWMSEKTFSPLISSLNVMVPNALKTSSTSKESAKEIFLEVITKDVTNLSPKRLEAYKYLLDKKTVQRSVFNKRYPGVKTYLDTNGYLKEIEKEKVAQSDVVKLKNPPQLTSKQLEVLEELDKEDERPILIHGATGSGKTEIYLQLAQKELDKNNQVLILVPEISLTPQMVERVKSRFGSSVAIYHSRLSSSERYMQYRLLQEGKATVVVGTRSAVFLPFSNLGLIVIDEEHDLSYKQDNYPRYHTLDIAKQRQKYHNCKLILGSATPSFESYSRAIKGVYKLIEILDRVFKQPLPTTYIVDTNKAMRNKESSILTNNLIEGIRERLNLNQQIILLVNRRGFSPVIRCRNCQSAVECDACDTTMTYHKDDNLLICHVCGRTKKYPDTCLKCGYNRFTHYGFGTQKVSEELSKLFPDARTIRMDHDTVQRKNGHEKLLDEFEKKGDILLGTQMIAKGLDFPRVTLVGIMNVDSMLTRTDFRSTERTFSLLVQASGRSGRDIELGEVIIQSFNPNHYCLLLAQKHDYKTFFYTEMKYRHLGNYPPYSYLISILVSSKSAERVYDAIEGFKHDLEDNNYDILGPSKLLKLNNIHRYRLIMKGKDLDYMHNKLKANYNRWLSDNPSLDIVIDVNPMVIE